MKEALKLLAFLVTVLSQISLSLCVCVCIHTWWIGK